MMTANKPRVGVSACLLGEEVRYDGGHKRNRTVIDIVGPHVEWVPVCPEAEVGMGTPREPLRLVSGEDGPRMMTVSTHVDYTDRMNAWARARVQELLSAGLDGYVLKSGSPSCGLEVPVLSERSESNAPGLFVATLMTMAPSLPVMDETRLEEAGPRAEFVARVIAHHQHRTRSGGV